VSFELCYYGDRELRGNAAPIEEFGPELQALVGGMLETMRREDGVGLAAPQVGVSQRVIVIDTSDGTADPYVLVNPEIVYRSDESVVEDEGCLSLPGITLNVRRAARVSVKAQDARGEPFTIENAEGLLAKAIQHEMDHINGILFIDHVSSVQRALLGGKLKKISKMRA
jgi:peptide deformylase